MNDDELFTPETIEERIDQQTSFPSSLSPSPNARVIRALQVYYQEDQRSAARMWERLVQQVRTAEIETSPGNDEKQGTGEIIMQQNPDSTEIREAELETYESVGQMGSSATPVRRSISRRTLVAGIGVGVAALGAAASYAVFSGRLTTSWGNASLGAASTRLSSTATQPPLPTGTEPPANGKLGDILTSYKRQKQLITDARWSPDGSLIASASYDQTVQIWRAASGKLLFTYNKHTDEVNSVDWSPDGKLLVSGGGNISLNEGVHDYSVQIWSASSGLVRTLSGPDDYIRPIRWSPDGKYIAAACYNAKAYVWEAAGGRLVTTYTGHQDSLTGLAWSPDSKRIVTSSADAVVQVWEATTGRNVLNYNDQQSHGLVLAVAWSPDGTRIASSSGGAGSDAVVNVWSAVTGKTLYVYQGHVQSALVTFPGGGTLGASLPFAPAHRASGSGIGVFSVAWSPDSKNVASGGGSGDGSVQIWNPTTRTKVFTLPTSNGGACINSLAWSPGGAHMASTSGIITTIWQSKA